MEPDNQPPYLAAEGLLKAFERPAGAATAVGPISFGVAERSFLSMVGASGCGKSTILGMVAGLITPTEGGVDLAGRQVAGPAPGMVYLFQQYSKSLLPWRTVERNVRLGLEAPARRQLVSRKERKSRCARYLDMVGLSGTEQYYPWELSGGMQQRVAIARALICEPKVLLMDEPFSAVDAITRASLQNLVLSLWEQLGITIIFVTHDIDEAIYLSDRVLVLTNAPGRIAMSLDIDLPRPRNQVSTRESQRFLDYRRTLLGEITG